MDRKLTETLPDLSVAADEKVDALGRTLMWHGGVQVKVDETTPSDAPAPGQVQIMQSVVITRTHTVSEAEAGRLLATLSPFRPAPPPQPLAARRPELDRTRIDLQQLPSKLRAAEIWAQQVKVGVGATTRVLEMAPTVPVVIDAHAELRLSWRERAAQLLRQLAANRPQLSVVQRKILVGLCAIGIGTLAGSAALELQRHPQPSAAKVSVAPAPQPTAAATHAPVAIERAAPETTLSTALTDAVVTQRSAVDALIAGQYEQAVARYRALAQAHPGEPAYAAAARILARDRAVAH